VKINKRAMTLCSVLGLALFLNGTIDMNPGLASDSHSPRPSARATPSPRASISSRATTNFAATNPSAQVSAQSSSTDCVKTNSTAHMPTAVNPPSVNGAKVDRVFTLNTNCGQIVFKAFGTKAPLTVLAMTTLAKAGYFDHSLCHRVTTSGFYVLQCGDPTARGTGGPKTTDGARWGPPDENLPPAVMNDYPAGTIAMANAGVSNSEGSQFFIVYKDTTLSNTYTIWGQVTSGLDIVKGIADAGVVGGGTDGTPKQTIAIESVSVK